MYSTLDDYLICSILYALCYCNYNCIQVLVHLVSYENNEHLLLIIRYLHSRYPYNSQSSMRARMIDIDIKGPRGPLIFMFHTKRHRCPLSHIILLLVPKISQRMPIPTSLIIPLPGVIPPTRPLPNMRVPPAPVPGQIHMHPRLLLPRVIHPVPITSRTRRMTQPSPRARSWRIMIASLLRGESPDVVA